MLAIKTRTDIATSTAPTGELVIQDIAVCNTGVTHFEKTKPATNNIKSNIDITFLINLSPLKFIC